MARSPLTLIHALQKDGSRRGRLLGMLQRRKSDMELSDGIRKLALENIKAAGGIEYTRKAAKDLERVVEASLSLYEANIGSKNFISRLVVRRLEFDDG